MGAEPGLTQQVGTGRASRGGHVMGVTCMGGRARIDAAGGLWQSVKGGARDEGDFFTRLHGGGEASDLALRDKVRSSPVRACDVKIR